MDKQFKNIHWYSGLIYLTDTESGWVEQIRQWGLPSVISPLHDKDLVRHGETLGPDHMAPHYHIMIRFPDMETDTVKSIMKSMHVSIMRHPEMAGSEFRSFCGIEDFVDICLREKRQKEHIPSCVQYPMDEIINMNGADFSKLSFIPTAENKQFSELYDGDRVEADIKLIHIIDSYQFLFTKEFEWFLSDPEITPDSRWNKIYEDAKDIFDRYIELRQENYAEGPIHFAKKMNITKEMFQRGYSIYTIN